MTRRNYDLRNDFALLRDVHSTWISSVYLNGGGTPYDDSWIQPIFNSHSTWISSVYLNGGGTPYDDSWIQPIFNSHSTWIQSLALNLGGGVGTQTGPVTWGAVNGSAAGTSPHTPALPTGITSGMLLVSLIRNNSAAAVFTATANWTIINQISEAGHTMAAAFRIAVGSATQDAIGWSWTGGGTASVNVSRFSGAAVANPIGAYAMNIGKGTQITVPAFTTIAGGSAFSDMEVANSQTIPTPVGYIARSVFAGGTSETMSQRDLPYSSQSTNSPTVAVTSIAWSVFLIELRSR